LPERQVRKPMENNRRLSSRKTGLWFLLAGLALVSILLWVGVQYRNNLYLADVLNIRAKKAEVLSRMRADLLRSVEAEKNAVMADTDKASLAFADVSRQAAQSMDKDRQELALLMEKDYSDRETGLLREFDRCATELHEVDHVILDLAVKNTNIKAVKLSFGPGAQVLKHFEEALAELNQPRGSSRPEDQIALKACEALVAALKMHDLHAPHIASPSDDEMDRIEEEMAQYAEIIKLTLNQLKGLVPEERRASLRNAEADYEELVRVSHEVFTLSRQNTNIKSFELSLGRKRKLTAQCDEILVSMQEAIRSKEFKATR
jgi:hypothetical protein